MDEAGILWHFPAMIPSWQLYGEASPFPDILHSERIVDRAAGMDWRIGAHRHMGLHQVFLIREGAITLDLDGTRLAPLPPVVLNIPPGVVHGFSFAAGTEGHVLTLPTADFPELSTPETAPLHRAFHAGGAGLEPAFDRIAALHDGSGPLRRLRLRAAALDLACAVTERAPVSATPGQDPRIARLEALVRGNLSEPRQSRDYAAALGLSDRHLRRLCLEATGLSAHGFIEQLRLREACRLLAYTRMQVQEVGFALGIDDPAYFARVFRRGMGLSPQDYRSRLG